VVAGGDESERDEKEEELGHGESSKLVEVEV
jgi:hypothetical protein